MFLVFKQGVKVRGISAETLLAIQVAHSIFVAEGLNCIITSVSEGKHMENSLHYKGKAVDLRLPHRSKVASIVNALRTALTDEYDVVLESDHIHIEFDPPKVPNELPPNKANA
jgi:hypothetical protein